MKGLMAGASLLALIATTAQAQTASPAAGGEERVSLVEELVVTARRREEALLEVPVSASALTAEQIAQRPIEKIEDFLRQTPSATVVFAGPEYLKDVSIRGQGGGRNGFSESATGVYRNGVYAAGGGFGGRSLNTLDLFDVRAFEVYRGPQGALFGRNSVGGAVNVVSQQPGFDPLASFGVSFDDRQRVSGQAILNAPLPGDRAAVRLGLVGYTQEEGFITDVATNQYVDDTQFVGARGALKVQAADDLSITFTLERSESDAPGFSGLGQRLPVAGRPTARIDPGVRTRNSSRYGRVDIEETTGYLNVEKEFDFADLAFVVTHKDRNAGRSNEDLDHFLGFEDVGGSDFTAEQLEDYSRTGAEVRLTSRGAGPLQWLIGADWQQSEDDVTTSNAGVTGVPPLRELVTRTDASREELSSYSMFGSLDWQVSPSLSLGLEARAQRDEKDFLFERIDRAPAPVDTSIAPVRSSFANTEISPGLTLTYEYAPEGQVYVRIASAYRPGGFNIGTNVVGSIPYGPETAWGGELGWKARLSRSLSVRTAAYYLTVDDAQVVSTVSTTDTTVVLQNVSGLDSWGLELEVDGAWDLGPGRLTVNVAASTQDGEFKDGAQIITNGVLYDISGQRANRQRDFIGSLSGTYVWPVNGAWEAWTTASLTTEMGGYENAVGQLKIPGVSRSSADYALLHLKAGVRSDDWTIAVFATNVTDEVFVVQEVLQNAYYNEGRVIGVEFKRRLGY